MDGVWWSEEVRTGREGDCGDVARGELMEGARGVMMMVGRKNRSEKVELCLE